MTDNNQDRSQTEGQSDADRETELRNQENETGQAQNQPIGQQQNQQFDQSKQNESAFGQQGQSAGGDTNLADSDQSGGQSATGQGSPGQASGSGFVGSGNDNSGDYLTKGEENQDFAAQGQGAQETSPGTSDIETGQSQDSDQDSDNI